MRHPVSRELFAYWDALRAGRSAPERSAIDPAAIRALLAYTFLLEIGETRGAGARDASFRLSGTRLNALFRRDLKGETFDRLWKDGDEIEASALIGGVLVDRVPVVAGLQAGPAGYPPVAFELLLLPLRHHGRTHARLLGSVVAGTASSWMGLRPIEGFHLVSFRSVLPGDAGRIGRFGVSARAAAAVPAPSHPAFLDAARTAGGARPWPFRVYQGGRASPPPALDRPGADPG